MKGQLTIRIPPSSPREARATPPAGTQACCSPFSPEVMQIRDLLHTQPAELAATHGTGHMVTAPIVHLDDVSAATWTRLDVISYGEEARD